MRPRLDAWTESDHGAVRALLRDPEIAAQNDMLLGPGRLEHWLADPFCHPALRFVARADGAPAGFAYGFLIGQDALPWAMLRPAVAAPWRRRGIGTRLLEAQLAALARIAPGCREVCLAAYEPCPEAAGFAARHGFRLVRRFWRMDRPAPDVPAPEWPAGIVTRTVTRDEAAIRDWTDAYNASFARHYHFSPTSYDEARHITAMPGFDPASVLLAYEGDRCVGFCRDEVFEDRGEIAALGVVPDVQGRGLGRALLRWGVRRLMELDARPVTLLVDGENEGALALYHSEGFEVAKTRHVWSREPRLPGALSATPD